MNSGGFCSRLRFSGAWLSRSILAPALCFLLSLSGYLTTRTEVHMFDALSYVLDVDRKPWHELFHPHHLAYGPLGALIRSGLHTLGWHISARVPMQVTNAIAGALGVALFFVVVRVVTHRTDLAWCGALLLGASYAYWYYAIEIEVYTIATVFLVVCLGYIVSLLRTPTPGICAGLGVAQGLAVLFHQTNILLSVPVLVAYILVRPGIGRRWVVAGLAYTLPLGIIVAGSYLLVGFGISGFRSWAQFMAWITAYARTGWWGGAITIDNWVDLGTGLANTVAQPGGALLGLLLLGLLICYLRHLVQGYRRLVLCLSAWLVTYGAFFFWWEPDNIEFWIASLPPLLLLLLLGLQMGGPVWHPGVWVALVLGLTMLAMNYDSITRRGRMAYDRQRRIAAALAAHSAPGDLLLVPDGLQELYLPYYEQRDNVLSLNQALFEHEGDWAAACRAVRQRITITREHGFAVWIDDVVLYPGSDRDETRLLERFRLTPQAVTQCFTPYMPELDPHLVAGYGIYHALPAAQTLLERSGWDFAHSRQGWRASNIEHERFVTGWEFIPGVDPQLKSPPLHIDTRRYNILEIDLAAATQDRDAQLFFYDEAGQVAEERSIRWTLPPGDAVITYRLELEGQPGWHGIVTGLRLDPVSVGDGRSVRVERVRLVPVVEE